MKLRPITVIGNKKNDLIGKKIQKIDFYNTKILNFYFWAHFLKPLFFFRVDRLQDQMN